MKLPANLRELSGVGITGDGLTPNAMVLDEPTSQALHGTVDPSKYGLTGRRSKCSASSCFAFATIQCHCEAFAGDTFAVVLSDWRTTFALAVSTCLSTKLAWLGKVEFSTLTCSASGQVRSQPQPRRGQDEEGDDLMLKIKDQHVLLGDARRLRP